jgi:single-strand DNA-binding protein
MDLNRITIIGRLGRDPEARTLPGGQSVVTFSVATSEKWKDKGGAQQERTTWHPVQVWGEGLGRTMMQYARKGARIYVEGSVRIRTYQDKNGHERMAYEVNVGMGDNVILLDSARSKAEAVMAPGLPPAQAPADLDDDIPF